MHVRACACVPCERLHTCATQQRHNLKPYLSTAQSENYVNTHSGSDAINIVYINITNFVTQNHILAQVLFLFSFHTMMHMITGKNTSYMSSMECGKLNRNKTLVKKTVQLYGTIQCA